MMQHNKHDQFVLRTFVFNMLALISGVFGAFLFVAAWAEVVEQLSAL